MAGLAILLGLYSSNFPFDGMKQCQDYNVDMPPAVSHLDDESIVAAHLTVANLPYL